MKSFNKYVFDALISKKSEINKINYKVKSKDELKDVIRKKTKDMIAKGSHLLYLSDIDISELDNLQMLFIGVIGNKNIYKIDISSWDTKNVTDMSYMFEYLEDLTDIIGLENLDVSKVERMNSMFSNCKKLQTLDLSKWKTHNLESMSSMFCNCIKLKEIKGIESFDTTSLNFIRELFRGCSSLESIDLNNWKIKEIYSLENLFKNCKKLKSVKIGNLNTDSVSCIDSMFENCQALKDIDDLSKWNMSYLSSAKKAFKKCYNLISIKGLDNWFKGSYQLNNKDFTEMFAECINLKDIGDIDYWKSIGKAKGMFKNTNIENLPSWYWE